MIPPRLLKQLAGRLTEQTRDGSISWRRERSDIQHYVHDLGAGKIAVYYNYSRASADTIELAVIDPNNQVIGSLMAEENDPGYDELADLVFEIQREQGETNRGVTDEILRFLKS